MRIAFSPRTLMSAAVITAATAALTTATGAFFTDSETSLANVFQAGTLNLSLNDWNSEQATTTEHVAFNVANMMPGDGGEKVIVLETTSDAWLKATLATSTITANPGEEATENLWQELEFSVQYSTNGTTYIPFVATTTLAVTPIELYSEDFANSYLHAGTPVYLKISYFLPTTTSNEAQGDGASFDMTVNAMQYANNAAGYKQ